MRSKEYRVFPLATAALAVRPWPSAGAVSYTHLNALFVMLKGSASVTKNISPKKFLDTMVAGNVFGEISFLIQIPRTSNVVALEDSVCFVLKGNKLDKLPLPLQVKFRDCLIDILVKRLIHLDNQKTNPAVFEDDIKE